MTARTWGCRLGWAAALVLVPAALPAQRLELAPGSTLRLEGTSTLHGWACEAERMHVRLLAGGAPVKPAAVRPGSGLGELIVPVGELECGDARMERQMRDALQASTHPDIRFTLESYTVRGAAPTLEVEARGTISVAGVSRPLTATVAGHLDPDGLVHARGSAPIRMSDFGIERPTAFFGLLKAGDEVVVRFDLRVRADERREIVGS